MARIFALLILVTAVTGAATGERFPILQPDQMNADQKKLLEALLAGPAAAPVTERGWRPCPGRARTAQIMMPLDFSYGVKRDAFMVYPRLQTFVASY